MSSPHQSKLQKRVDIQKQKVKALRNIIWTLRGLSLTFGGMSIFGAVGGTIGLWSTDGPTTAITVPGVILGLIAYGVSAAIAIEGLSEEAETLAEREERVEDGYQAEVYKQTQLPEHHALVPIEKLDRSQRSDYDYGMYRKVPGE